MPEQNWIVFLYPLLMLVIAVIGYYIFRLLIRAVSTPVAVVMAIGASLICSRLILQYLGLTVDLAYYLDIAKGLVK